MADKATILQGQCQLRVDSTSQISLQRYNGRHIPIKIAGVWEAKIIPASGPTLSNSGLTAGTLYYVYAFDSSGTLTLEAVTTTHATDTDRGIEIKSGDATRTLVGAALMGTGSPGTFSPIGDGTLSLFNGSPEGTLGNPVAALSSYAYGPVSKLVPLDQSGWSWFNQGSAVVTQGGGIVNLESPTASGTNIRGRLRGSYPSPPFILIVGVRPKFQSAGSVAGLGLLGLTVSDGTKHKACVASNFNFNTANGPPALWVGRYNSATSAVSATVIDSILAAASGVPVWLKLEDNNTNQIFSFSLNKVTWTQILSEARTTHLTPSDLGLVIGCQSGSQNQGGDIISWEIR